MYHGWGVESAVGVTSLGRISQTLESTGWTFGPTLANAWDVPSILVCALLGLAVAVLIDVARAPGPLVRVVETPVVIIGLERLRRIGPLPRPSHRPRSTPVILDLPDVAGELETAPARAALPSVPKIIVDEPEELAGRPRRADESVADRLDRAVDAAG